MTKKDVDLILLEAVDEALKDILGESGREVVYYQFKCSYGLKKEDIPKILKFLWNFCKIFRARSKNY